MGEFQFTFKHSNAQSKMATSVVADMDLVSLPFYVCITQKWCQEYFVGCWTLQASGVTRGLVHLEDVK